MKYIYVHLNTLTLTIHRNIMTSFLQMKKNNNPLSQADLRTK